MGIRVDGCSLSYVKGQNSLCDKMSISYKKDIDGLIDVNMGRFYKGEKSFIPCTVLSVIVIENACRAWRDDVY
jgi:5,10-methylene-tetrahydrofolate dehydrogenase/methenyl tetrahydrofolate cyclohydrolase